MQRNFADESITSDDVVARDFANRDISGGGVVERDFANRDVTERDIADRGIEGHRGAPAPQPTGLNTLDTPGPADEVGGGLDPLDPRVGTADDPDNPTGRASDPSTSGSERATGADRWPVRHPEVSTFRPPYADVIDSGDPAGMQVGPATENAEENAKEKLGEILVREGWITAEQRDWATEVQERTGCRLGAILVAAGLIRRDAVYRVLARTWDCEFVDLVNTPLDLSLLDGLDPHLLAEEGWIPYGRDGERILVATSERPTLERQRSILDRLCAPVSLVVTTDWDILQSLNTAFRETVVEQATLGLWRRDRMQSARQVLLAGQRVVARPPARRAGGRSRAGPPDDGRGAQRRPEPGLPRRRAVQVRGLHGRGAAREPGAGRRRGRRRARPPATCPTYTVLVPVYKEANVVADLIDNLGALDYPREKLEILLLLEEDDDRDDRGGAGGAATVDDHVPHGAARAAADQAQGLQRRPVLRPRRVPGDLRRRGQAGARPAEEGRDRVPPRRRPSWCACRRR